MKLVVPKLDVEYFGLDIVDHVIEKKAEHSNLKRTSRSLTFVKMNSLLTFLMIRDCLFHLSFQDTSKILLNLSKSDYKFLLTTTHVLPASHANFDSQVPQTH